MQRKKSQWTAWCIMSKSNDAEKENFLVQVEWLPLTSQPWTDRLTDKSKISMISWVQGCTVIYFIQNFTALKNSRQAEKTLKIESPPSVKHPWSTSTPESHSFEVIRPTLGRPM